MKEGGKERREKVGMEATGMDTKKGEKMVRSKKEEEKEGKESKGNGRDDKENR